MSYKNKGYKKPKTPVYKNNYSVKKVDTKQDKAIKKLTKDVAKLQTDAEVKIHDDQTLLNVPGVTGDFYWNLNIAQGDDVDQRVGEEIILKKQEWIVSINSTATTVNKRYRVILFMDTQTNGNPPAPFTSISPTSGLLDNSTISDTFYSPLNYRTNERYKVYYDKTHIFNIQDTLAASRHVIKCSKSFNTKIKYASSQDTLDALASKNVWIMVLGAQQALSGTYDVFCRTYFTDS